MSPPRSAESVLSSQSGKKDARKRASDPVRQSLPSVSIQSSEAIPVGPGTRHTPSLPRPSILRNPSYAPSPQVGPSRKSVTFEHPRHQQVTSHVPASACSVSDRLENVAPSASPLRQPEIVKVTPDFDTDDSDTSALSSDAGKEDKTASLSNTSQRRSSLELEPQSSDKAILKQFSVTRLGKATFTESLSEGSQGGTYKLDPNKGAHRTQTRSAESRKLFNRTRRLPSDFFKPASLDKARKTMHDLATPVRDFGTLQVRVTDDALQDSDEDAPPPRNEQRGSSAQQSHTAPTPQAMPAPTQVEASATRRLGRDVTSVQVQEPSVVPDMIEDGEIKKRQVALVYPQSGLCMPWLPQNPVSDAKLRCSRISQALRECRGSSVYKRLRDVIYKFHLDLEDLNKRREYQWLPMAKHCRMLASRMIEDLKTAYVFKARWHRYREVLGYVNQEDPGTLFFFLKASLGAMKLSLRYAEEAQRELTNVRRRQKHATFKSKADNELVEGREQFV